MSIEIVAAESARSQAALKGKEKQRDTPSPQAQTNIRDAINLTPRSVVPSLYTQREMESAVVSTSSTPLVHQQPQRRLHEKIDHLGNWLRSNKAKSLMYHDYNEPHAPEDVAEFVNETTAHLQKIQRQFHSDRTLAQLGGKAFPSEHSQESFKTLEKRLTKIDIITNNEQYTIRRRFGGQSMRALAMLVAPGGKTRDHSVALKHIKELRSAVQEVRRLMGAQIPSCPTKVVKPEVVKTLKKSIDNFARGAQPTITQKTISMTTFTKQTRQLLKDIETQVGQNRPKVERGQATLPQGYPESKNELHGTLYQLRGVIEMKREQIRSEYGRRIIRQLKARWNPSSGLKQLNSSLVQLKSLYPNIEAVGYRLLKPDTRPYTTSNATEHAPVNPMAMPQTNPDAEFTPSLHASPPLQTSRLSTANDLVSAQDEADLSARLHALPRIRTSGLASPQESPFVSPVTPNPLYSARANYFSLPDRRRPSSAP